MAKVKFNVACVAVYQSELDIPDEIKDDEKAILKYIHDNLDKCPVSDLEWLNDMDPEEAVTAEDLRYVEE